VCASPAGWWLVRMWPAWPCVHAWSAPLVTHNSHAARQTHQPKHQTHAAAASPPWPRRCWWRAAPVPLPCTPCGHPASRGPRVPVCVNKHAAQVGRSSLSLGMHDRCVCGTRASTTAHSAAGVLAHARVRGPFLCAAGCCPASSPAAASRSGSLRASEGPPAALLLPPRRCSHRRLTRRRRQGVMPCGAS
jgi:hypothetical protein